MPTTTTNYGFDKPLVNDPTDEDVWGGETNDNWDSLDTLLKTATDMLPNPQGVTYTVILDDRNKMVLMDTSGGAKTATLPALTDAGLGFTVSLKKIDSSTNLLTIAGSGSDTIEDDANVTASNQYDTYTLVAGSDKWYVLTKPIIVESEVPAGTLFIWGGSPSSVPVGYLLCDGSAVSRTTYSVLFTAISTNFGVGDNATTFNLPAPAGKFLRGFSTDSTVDPDGPRAVGSVQADAFQNHQHQTNILATGGGGGGSLAGQNSTPQELQMTQTITDQTGLYGTARFATETRPKNLAVAYIIKF